MSYRIVSLNVNGWRSAVAKGLLAWIADVNPDVICLQETRASDESMRFLSPDKYHVISNGGQDVGRHGVAILSKETPSQPCRAMDRGLVDDVASGRFVSAEFPGITIASVYVPNGIPADRVEAKHAFLLRLESVMTGLNSGGRSAVVAGDLNLAHSPLDVHDPKQCARFPSGFTLHESQWMDRVLAAGWVDCFRLLHPDQSSFTRFQNRSCVARGIGWRLDYQLATVALASTARVATHYYEKLFSDHRPVIVDYEWSPGG